MKRPRPVASGIRRPGARLLPHCRRRAEDAVTLNISMKGHRFQPAELHAPAGKPIIIVVKNLDPAPAEFESNMLRVEKVVTGGGTITLRIRPLDPGRYRFFDDFHPETEGYLVVK